MEHPCGAKLANAIRRAESLLGEPSALGKPPTDHMAPAARNGVFGGGYMVADASTVILAMGRGRNRRVPEGRGSAVVSAGEAAPASR